MQALSTLLFLCGLLFLLSCGVSDTDGLTGTGTLEATEVTVSSEVSGVVRTLRVTEGSSVRAGDTLVVIDSTEWKLQLLRAEANLRGAEAQLKLTLEGPRKEDVAQAQASFESARADLVRMQELRNAGTISQKQFDDANTRFVLAEQALVKMKKGSRAMEIELARAHRDQARAQVESLRKKVRDCTVRAPIAGSVVNTFVETGELISPGGSLVRLSDLSIMNLVVYLPEKALPDIQLGQRATITIDAYDDRTFEGEVAHISPTAEFTPRNIQTKEERVKLVFAVKIRVANPDRLLKSGIPADATIHTNDQVPAE